jgi:hypothetical protein
MRRSPRSSLVTPTTGFLGLPESGNVIVLNDSKEEEEACDDDRADAEATPSSTGDSSAPTVFATDDEAPDGVQDGSSGGSTPDRVQGDSSVGGNEAGSP